MMKEKELFDLSDKVVILTGGLGLLGLHFAEALLKSSAVLNIIDIAGLKEMEEILNAQQWKDAFLRVRLHYHQGDITDKRSLTEIRDKCIQKFGEINVLLNVAALNPKVEKRQQNKQERQTKVVKTFEETNLNDWNRELNVNLTGTMLCCQVFAAAMKHGSSIINISSVYGIIGPDQRLYGGDFLKPASYSASKGGVVSFTKWLASYFGEKGIRVNCCVFGGVENGQNEEFVKKYSAKTFLGRMAKPDEFNGLIVYLASDSSSYMTGSTVVIDGGFT